MGCGSSKDTDSVFAKVQYHQQDHVRLDFFETMHHKGYYVILILSYMFSANNVFIVFAIQYAILLNSIIPGYTKI